MSGRAELNECDAGTKMLHRVEDTIDGRIIAILREQYASIFGRHELPDEEIDAVGEFVSGFINRAIALSA